VGKLVDLPGSDDQDLAAEAGRAGRAEEGLRKSERLLLDAEALGHVGTWEHDFVSGEVYSSEENRRLFFGPDRSRGRKMEDYGSALHPGDRPRVLEQHEALLAGAGSPAIEFRVVWPDGSVHWIYGYKQIVRDQSGKPLRQFGANLDITERKRNEEELDRRLRQQAAVVELGMRALRGDGLQALFGEAVRSIASTFPVEFAELAELLPNDTLLLRAEAGWKEGLVGRATFPARDGSQCAFTMRSGTPSIVEDLTRETRFTVDPLILDQGMTSGVTVLIEGAGRPFGTLGAHSKDRRSFTGHDVHFLQAMANVLAAAIERERAADELRDKGEQLQALSGKLIEAQEAERRAIARELHDDLGQLLTAVRLNLQKSGGDRAESITLVDQAIAHMRDLALDLRPPVLDDLGLAAALRWYVAREAKRAGIEARLEVEDLPRLPAVLETTCFRVVQEGLTNVARHAKARRVEVELGVHGATLELAVRDDGRGFDVREALQRAAEGRSLGLLGMKERISLARGVLEIDAGPGRGTAIRVRFPVKE